MRGPGTISARRIGIRYPDGARVNARQKDINGLRTYAGFSVRDGWSRRQLVPPAMCKYLRRVEADVVSGKADTTARRIVEGTKTLERGN